MKQKHWQVSVFDKTSEIIRDDTFYTTDTEAYLVFELIDEDFSPDSAMVTVYNIYGTALINASVEVANGIARYEMPKKAIRHSGGWRTQAIFTKDNEDYTTRIIEFDVGGHLLDNKKPHIVEIENWNSFIEHAGELIDDWEQLEEIRQANEQQRESAESARQTTFETNESTRQSEFETNETSRQASELVREEAELARESAESERVLNEEERILKDSERDSKIEAVEEELNQHKLDYVEYLASELGEEHIIRSLPNGVKDEIRVSGGKVEYIQRTKKQILQAASVNVMVTKYANVDYARVHKPSDSSAFNKFIDGIGSMTIEGLSEVGAPPDYENVVNINKIILYAAGQFIWVGFEKGTTLEQARTQLTGLTLTYQLAEPILIPLPEQMTPNTMEIVRLSEQVNKLTSAIISLGGTIV